MDKKYTGRQIAIFADVHGLLEPLVAVIEDIKKRNITEIYSLGDNVGFGPSSPEVIDMLECYDIKSVAGNAEEYCTIGISPFRQYFSNDKMKSQEWTKFKLGDRRIEYIRSFPHSIDLEFGGKKLALCHFANDVRTDYGLNGSDKYMYNLATGESYKQFLYTNSAEHLETIRYNIDRFGADSPKMKGFVSANDYPIFDGKMVTYYDAIIQGHMHRNLYEKGENTEFHTIRAMALHFDSDPVNLAFYIVLSEKVNGMGFDIERVYVPFDRRAMENTILRCDEPSGKIRKLVCMN